MNKQELYDRCARFHGHICGGLTIGFQAAMYAASLLNLHFSQDEEVVCISENDACGIDAIQVLLGCTLGKGNLLFHITGKQAFSFYVRSTGKSVRLVLRPTPPNMDKAQRLHYLQTTPPEQLFDVKETVLKLPEKARIFESFPCDCCGEMTASNWVHLENGRKLCADCWNHYDRVHVI